MREVLSALGLVPRGGNYETVWRRIREQRLDAAHLVPGHRSGRLLRTCSPEEIAQAVRVSRSNAQVLAALGIRPGGSGRRLKARMEELGLDTSHFLGQAWRRVDKSVRSGFPPRPLEEVLVRGRPSQISRLKKRLLAEGIKERRCEMCGTETWNGMPIPLELDHVNGRREDNRLSNLRMLCPNCHAQTPTYRGRGTPGTILGAARVAKSRQPPVA